MSNRAEVDAAYTRLEVAVAAFKAEIEAFRAVHDTETVGLDYWAAGLDDTMFEISEDIDVAYDPAASNE